MISLRACMLLGTAVLAATVSAAYLGLHVATDRLHEASERRAHSEVVIARTNRVEKLLLDLETGSRGFVITGASRFLEPWRVARTAFPEATTRLAEMVRDNPVQERLATAIREAGAAYLRGWSEPLTEAARRDPARARRIVRSGRGNREVDALRGRFKRLIANEQALALKRSADARRSASRADAFAIGGVTGSLALIALAGIVFARSIGRPLDRLGAAADRMGADDLSVRVARRGPSELVAVADSFNAMARSLQDSRAQLLEARGQADRSNRAKSEFLSRMSHELRTPLNAILGFGQVLDLDPLDERQRDSVGHILKAGRHLLALIDEVLEISRIEAGELALSPEPVPIAETVREVLALVAPLATPRDVQLRVDMGGLGEGAHVCADRQRLRQVLLNLLSNAIKYNRIGGRVDVWFAPGESGCVRMLVADTGLGIEQEQLAGLFEPFARLGAEFTEVEGTGLGLALAKRLVETMGGSITVESKPGQGTTFAVELEAAVPPDTGRAAEIRRSAAQEIPNHLGPEPRRLLYIEDNLSNLTLVERILDRQPAVELIPAMQGSLGLELAREHHPALIVLDLHLPDMSGQEVLRRLKTDDATREIPVVVLSADASKKQMGRLMGLGALDYLTKPLDVRQFLDVVVATLDAHEHA